VWALLSLGYSGLFMSDDYQAFEAWWNSDDSPRRHMSATAQHFCKPFMRQAFNAGKTNWRPRQAKEQRERFTL